VTNTNSNSNSTVPMAPMGTAKQVLRWRQKHRHQHQHRRQLPSHKPNRRWPFALILPRRTTRTRTQTRTLDIQNAFHHYTVSENLVNNAIAPWEFHLYTNKLSFISYISTKSNNFGNINNNSYVRRSKRIQVHSLPQISPAGLQIQQGRGWRQQHWRKRDWCQARMRVPFQSLLCLYQNDDRQTKP